MNDTRNLMLPGNPRYQPNDLLPIFGYDNLFVPFGEVEIATMQTLGEIGEIPPNDMSLLTPEIIQRILDIPTTEVDRVERALTNHDVRAWVRMAQEILPAPLRRWIHIPNTSYDPLDTARSLQFSRAHQWVIKESLLQVMRLFSGLVVKFADTIQIGRTHGQHAMPITAGFWLATILYRILYNAQMLDMFASNFVGKISGAVGAHNAQFGLGFIYSSGPSFEERVLSKLGLMPAPISTQILPPEPLAYYLFASCMLSAAFGQFGRDCRQLMRTEIAEISEPFTEGQVGSSTMAHKRNPVTFENLEGTWIRTKNEFGKVMDTLISEHQRDLVGSSVARDFPIIIINLKLQLDTLLRKDKKSGLPFLQRISINEEACRKNLGMSANVVLSEPVYIALQMSGFNGDAHELVTRRGVPLAQSENIPLIEAMQRIADDDAELADAMKSIPPDIIQLLHHPERYIGDARERALAIAKKADNFISRQKKAA